jgi:hypothetical protein
MTQLFRTAPVPAPQSELGPLAGLVGKWVGRGFNLMFLPDFDKTAPSTGPQMFRVLLNTTQETLQISPIGSPVPNRGSEVFGSSPLQGQNDINIFGVQYLQSISDANTHEPLHVEPGFWLNVPGTQIPASGSSIVRQGSIPHGTSILLQGSAYLAPGNKPAFDVTTPITTPVFKPQNPSQTNPMTGLGYLEPLTLAKLPAPYTDSPFAKQILDNPNIILQNDIAPVLADITSTTVLNVNSGESAGLLNIPFLQNSVNNNAAATSCSAIFWIETVTPKTGKPYRVLQYTQTVMLNFIGVDWPHVSVATLYAQ